ncbi:PREDICTED: ras-related protein Rab-7L1-like [Branchiostoma belcheri]|uniref:Ras-related protein Rab n=1 Tax=Branchiostoma belcheri TaxID=7741 RepID=A0A6P4Z3E0_BRABE|nr:PREDICTED: ras-related protein Rab-7L1-like [Branchiostoma belcheri]KAI8511497.1 multi-organism toxin transport [Branchiostoma belcheri]
MTERLFKILIIGDATVGKTSFVQRYVNDSFKREYKATVGVDFALKVIQISEEDTIRFQLWDVAGQERFTSMTRVYYKDASACVIIFDVTAKQTFHNCLKWKKDLDSKVSLPDGRCVPCMLLANKIDLQEKAVTEEEVNEFCKENNFIGWTEISVKDNVNVKESMNFLLEEILARHTDTQPQRNMEAEGEGGHIKLKDNAKQAKEGRSCCGS